MDSRNIYGVILALLITQFVSAQGIVKTGVYTWADSANFNSGVKLASGAHNGYVLTSDSFGHVSWQPSSGSGSGWSLTGNAGTTAAANFIGPTDGADFRIQADSNEILLKNKGGVYQINAMTDTYAFQDAEGNHTPLSIDALLQNTIIAGSFTYDNPTKGAGKVLTSDAIGNSSWASKNLTQNTPTPINSTATATTSQILSGYITSTSGAATVITLPTATALGTALGATQGTIFDLTIDNSNGSNNVTIQVNTGIQAITPAITGGANLVVSTANLIGQFRITFITSTNAIIARVE